MRYSTESKLRTYVNGYGFLSFAKKVGDKYGKKIMNTATKTWIDVAKSASKRVVQKTAEASGDLIGNKIANKITSRGISKNDDNKESRRNLHSARKKTTNNWWP